MKYEVTASFKNDLSGLSDEHKQLFREAVADFIKACDEFATQGGAPQWPVRLRVKSVVGSKGIWEMTWSFAGPDGRATWEWIKVDGELAVRWRRVGDHRIVKKP